MAGRTLLLGTAGTATTGPATPTLVDPEPPCVLPQGLGPCQSYSPADKVDTTIGAYASTTPVTSMFAPDHDLTTTDSLSHAMPAPAMQPQTSQTRPQTPQPLRQAGCGHLPTPTAQTPTAPSPMNMSRHPSVTRTQTMLRPYADLDRIAPGPVQQRDSRGIHA